MRRSFVLLALVGLSSGCTSEPEDGACGGMACEVPMSRAELLEELEGFTDPVADYLRQAAASDGTIGADWAEVLDGVRRAQGCAQEAESTFVVLSNQAYRPKGLVTHCTDDPAEASRVFTVFEPDHDAGDIDEFHFRMASWDEAAGRYRRYQVVPTPGDLSVAVDPGFCKSCHGGPFELTDWVPIMNEMTNPWAQWHTEPDFTSFLFEEHFNANGAGPVYGNVADPALLDSASNLEPIVRAAIDRVTASRIHSRTEAADLEIAGSLLRPVFCDEGVNFVSESHRSGELRQSALIDLALGDMLRNLAAQGEGDPDSFSWSWLEDETARVTPPADGEEPLGLFAVRGEATIQAEASLVSRAVLTAQQVLAVRALDWTHPVASQLRCSLYEDGMARARDGAIDAGDYADNGELVSALYTEAMQLTTAVGLVPIEASAPDRIIAIPDAELPQAKTALSEANLAGFDATLSAMGEAIESYVSAMEAPESRTRLRDERDRRGCLVRAAIPTAPIIPGTEDCI